jgi:hypothetical protein
MANSVNISPVLGGSPLGLVTRSGPTRDGISNFTGGATRNVNVNDYNAGRKQSSSNLDSDGNPIQSRVSLFTGRSIPQFWGNIGKIGTDQDSTGFDSSYNTLNRSVLHNDDIYDTSILNIIEKLSFSSKAALRAQDFAYLKDIGVFPNNRLMIARRFDKPMKDNILDKGGTPPLSVLIGWKPQSEDFLDIDFGEKWEDADADFTKVINNLGQDFSIGGAGSGMGSGINFIPLAGFTENLQRDFLAKLGILDNNDQPLPTGNPNIIKMAKRRKTIGYGENGSGLSCTVSIKMVVKYEQKFISGIDPTIAWMDIVSNATSFGTSNSTNYGLSSNFANNINRWTGKNGISSLIDEIIGAITESFEGIKSKVVNLVNNIIEGNAEAGLDAITDAAGNAGGLFDAISDSISKTIQKYRVQLLGITHALSGLPSTPWHITVGNPLRPIFCSGDMYTDRVNLKLGPTLSFNDLPSDITVEFTLRNARPLGLQEILAKFNTGYLRTINTRKDYLSDISTPPNGDGEYVDGGGYFFNTEDNVNQVENVTGTEVISSQTTNTNTTTTSNGATNNLPVGIGASTDPDSVGPTLPPSQNGASTKETDL